MSETDDVARGEGGSEPSAPDLKDAVGEAPLPEASSPEVLLAEVPSLEPGGSPTPTVVKKKRSQRLRDTLIWIRDHYCVMEPRTAGIYRWVVGFLCVADMLRHWGEARWFYSNDGVLTNHYHLWRPSSGYNFSVFHAFSSLTEVHIIFAIFVLCHFFFMIGWRTKLFSILSFVAVTSLDNRLVMVENGGYVVVNLVVAYAMFLPTGKRFSVDAWLRSWRERKESTVAELNERYRPDWAYKPYTSLAVLLVVLNLAVVYFFNVVNKSGHLWRTGQTVHYVLHLNRMVTGLAVWFRELFPYWTTRPVTWAVLCTEAVLVGWILSPYAKRITRTLAMIGILLLHTSFGVMMRLGPFAWFMIGWSMCLIAPEQWTIAEGWYRRKAAPRVVVYDRSSPLAFAACRVLGRLDNLQLLRFEESPEIAIENAAPELLLARDEASGQVFTGIDAFRQIVQALPGGRFGYWVVRIGTLGLLGPILSFASRRRAALTRYFGLAIPPRGREQTPSPWSPLRRRLWNGGMYLRETLLVWVAICSVLQAIAENKAVPAWARPKMPGVMSATLVYPRMFQGWGMFAPNPITDDGSVSIDAITLDGRHVDPFTGEVPDLDISDSRGLGLGQIRQDYFNRIRLDRNKVFRQPLQDYLRNWHKETGRPQDELVAFDVYWVRAMCPPPGQKHAYNNEKIALLTYRKSGYRPAPGLPPLPPEPKVESADTVDPKAATATPAPLDGVPMLFEKLVHLFKK
ncbi:MAG: HTTM domain-containing protein [Byssovorax sp.]